MTAQPPLVPHKMNEFSRLIGIYFSPGETFKDVVARPGWWVPSILIALFAFGYVTMFSRKVGWEQMVRERVDASAGAQNMSGLQREQAVQTGVKIARLTGVAGPVLGIPISFVAIALVLMFLTDNMMSGAVGFTRMLAIVAYAHLVQLLFYALAILVMFLKNPEDFDLQNPLAFNLAVLLPASPPQWAVALAGSFDVFTLWILALQALGISVASPKLGFGRAFRALLLLWLVWVAIRTALAYSFGR